MTGNARAKAAYQETKLKPAFMPAMPKKRRWWFWVN